VNEWCVLLADTLNLVIPCTIQVGQEGQKSWIDLGGQWIGDTQTHLAQLARNLNVTSFPTPHFGNDVFFMSGKRTVHNMVRTLQDTRWLSRMTANMTRACPAVKRVSVRLASVCTLDSTAAHVAATFDKVIVRQMCVNSHSPCHPTVRTS
jgi:monoamine oxidase